MATRKDGSALSPNEESSNVPRQEDQFSERKRSGELEEDDTQNVSGDVEEGEETEEDLEDDDELDEDDFDVDEDEEEEDEKDV
jgi:hypothetical protein